MRENPYAPATLNGINAMGDGSYADVDFSYLYPKTLTALQSLNDETVLIETDSWFHWRGLVYTSTGPFSVQFINQAGYRMSSGLILSANLSSSATDPFPILPEEIFDPGGKIGLNIVDLSNATNTIQIMFRGVKRYKRTR